MTNLWLSNKLAELLLAQNKITKENSSMTLRYRTHLGAIIIGSLAIMGAVVFSGCGSQKPAANNVTSATNTAPTPDLLPYATAPLPENGYKAKITLPDPPAKLRAGEKVVLQVKVQNASDVLWKVRGGGADNKFYIAVGDRWLAAEGEKLVTDMDGRYGLPRDLKPGEEAKVPLLITAPKEPGDYILELDLVQEQVAWFHEKGSEMARVKIKVER
jgi:hypothetical protein